MPFLGHEVPGADVDVFDHGYLWGEGAEVGGCPWGEGEVGERHCESEGGDGGREVGRDGGAVVAGPCFEA